MAGKVSSNVSRKRCPCEESGTIAFIYHDMNGGNDACPTSPNLYTTAKISADNCNEQFPVFKWRKSQIN